MPDLARSHTASCTAIGSNGDNETICRDCRVEPPVAHSQGIETTVGFRHSGTAPNPERLSVAPVPTRHCVADSHTQEPPACPLALLGDVANAHQPTSPALT